MDYAKESLRLHEQWKGKIEVIATVPVATKEDLSLAYTPGVAEPCLAIQKDISKSYDLTRRHNLCLVVTDGSAVLGLGDIGPEAGMPVMEGKCVLFKAFGGVDAFPLCVKTKDVDEFVNTVYNISGSFGGINLEDIAAPRCFEIEKKLKEKCDKAGMPVAQVMSMKDIFEDPHYKARNDIVDVQVEEDFGHVKMPNAFPFMTETPGRIKWPGQKLGASNEAIYKGLLGMSDSEIAELKEKKVI